MKHNPGIDSEFLAKEMLMMTYCTRCVCFGDEDVYSQRRRSEIESFHRARGELM
jgi:hypothetical protein